MKELVQMVNGIADELKKVYDGTFEELNEDNETMTFWDYFIDALDVEYTIGYDMQFRGVRVLVACGGPNIWIDTVRGEVFGAWGSDRADAWIPVEICEAINEVFEDSFQCAR